VSLRARLTRLERGRLRPGADDCPRPEFGALIRAGEPEPLPAAVGRCRTCGGRHVLHLVEVLVADADQANALSGELLEASGVVRQ